MWALIRAALASRYGNGSTTPEQRQGSLPLAQQDILDLQEMRPCFGCVHCRSTLRLRAPSSLRKPPLTPEIIVNALSTTEED